MNVLLFELGSQLCGSYDLYVSEVTKLNFTQTFILSKKRNRDQLGKTKERAAKEEKSRERQRAYLADDI